MGLRAGLLIEVKRYLLNQVVLEYHWPTLMMTAMQLSNTWAWMLRIVSFDCVNSFKYVKLKTTLPNIALVCGVPVNDTDVVAVFGSKMVDPASLSA